MGQNTKNQDESDNPFQETRTIDASAAEVVPQEIIISEQACSLLYQPHLLQNPVVNLLSGDSLPRAESSKIISSGGRGQAWFVEIDGLSCVLRKYRRGGMIARLVKHTYFSFNLENTRSVAEYRLLQWMHEQGLAVPLAVAASVCRWPFKFSPFYRAQILVQRIADVQTLDQLLIQRELSAIEWQRVAQCIRQFHNAGVYHADLNANNILLDKKGKVYLIDFDKSELRNSHTSSNMWMQDNLQRLKRSLLKQQLINSQYNFSRKNWQCLIDAYDASASI